MWGMTQLKAGSKLFAGSEGSGGALSPERVPGGRSKKLKAKGPKTDETGESDRQERAFCARTCHSCKSRAVWAAKAAGHASVYASRDIFCQHLPKHRVPQTSSRRRSRTDGGVHGAVSFPPPPPPPQTARPEGMNMPRSHFVWSGKPDVFLVACARAPVGRVTSNNPHAKCILCWGQRNQLPYVRCVSDVHSPRKTTDHVCYPHSQHTK